MFTVAQLISSAARNWFQRHIYQEVLDWLQHVPKLDSLVSVEAFTSTMTRAHFLHNVHGDFHLAGIRLASRIWGMVQKDMARRRQGIAVDGLRLWWIWKGMDEFHNIFLPNVGPSRQFVLSPSWRRRISKCKQCKQEDTTLDLSSHSLNTLFCMHGVRCKRVCIKFPGIGSCRYRTVPRRPHDCWKKLHSSKCWTS